MKAAVADQLHAHAGFAGGRARVEMALQAGRGFSDQAVQRLELTGAVGVKSEIVLEAVDVDAEHRSLLRYPPSADFTRALAFAKSICPVYFAFSAPITLPMSLIPAAPVSAMAAEIAAFTSSSDICFGR